MTVVLRGNRGLTLLCDEVLTGLRRLRALPEAGGQGGRGAVRAGGPFREHRRYVRGDDPQRVDWHVFARTGELNIKLFESDRANLICLVLDLSSSMEFGRPPRWHRALEAAALVVYTGLALADRVEVHVYAGGGRNRTASFTGGGALQEGWAFLEGCRTGGRGSMRSTVERAITGRRGGELWLISDFMPLDEGVLETAGERRFSVRGIMPLVPQDLEPGAPANSLMRGLEGEGEELLRVSSKLQSRVVALWEEEMARVASRLAATGGNLTLVPPSRPAAAYIRALG